MASAGICRVRHSYVPITAMRSLREGTGNVMLFSLSTNISENIFIGRDGFCEDVHVCVFCNLFIYFFEGKGVSQKVDFALWGCRESMGREDGRG